MPTFHRSVIIDAPVDLVFAFHERRGSLEPGATVELRVAFRPWISRHTALERPDFFVDEQLQGPFAKWVHRHEFEDLGDTTRLTDRVEYELPGGPFARLLLTWPARLGMALAFRHRHQVTKRYCESEAAR